MKMMKGAAAAIVAAWCVVVVAAAAQVPGAAPKVSCDLSELESCVPAIIGGRYPTAECCSRMKEQQPCFCKYITDPEVTAVIVNPNAGKTAALCNVTMPICAFV